MPAHRALPGTGRTGPSVGCLGSITGRPDPYLRTSPGNRSRFRSYAGAADRPNGCHRHQCDVKRSIAKVTTAAEPLPAPQHNQHLSCEAGSFIQPKPLLLKPHTHSRPVSVIPFQQSTFRKPTPRRQRATDGNCISSEPRATRSEEFRQPPVDVADALGAE
jgi:hypothetical protein